MQIGKGLGFSNKCFATQNEQMYVLLATMVLVLKSSQPVSDTDTQTYAKIEMCRENDVLLAGYISFSSRRRKTLHIFDSTHSLTSYGKRFQVSDLIHTMP